LVVTVARKVHISACGDGNCAFVCTCSKHNRQRSNVKARDVLTQDGSVVLSIECVHCASRVADLDTAPQQTFTSLRRTDFVYHQSCVSVVVATATAIVVYYCCYFCRSLLAAAAAAAATSALLSRAAAGCLQVLSAQRLCASTN
jgi:hypothetical protein